MGVCKQEGLMMKKLLFLFVMCVLLLEGYSYKGCYRDSNERDLNGYSFSSEAIQIDDCATLCKKKGFRYMGLQYSSYCFCGNSYGKHGKANNCNMPCSGEHDKTCGGSWANSVYDLSDKEFSLEEYFHHDVNVEPWFERWHVVAVPMEAKNLVGKIAGSNERFGWKHPVRDIGDAMPPKGANGAALYLHPVSPQKPAVMKMRLLVTNSTEAINIRVAGNRNGDFTLIVKVNSQQIFKQSVDGKKWYEYTLSLAPYLNETVALEVDIAASGWYYEYAFIDEITFSKKRETKAAMTMDECGVYQDPTGQSYLQHRAEKLDIHNMTVFASCKVHNAKKGTAVTGSWYFVSPKGEKELIMTKTFALPKDIRAPLKTLNCLRA